MFDSDKKGGFKALSYIHRYQPDIITRTHTDYVHEQQNRYHTAVTDLQQRISGASTGDRVKLTKQLIRLEAQAEGIRTYGEKIHHLVDQMIPVDLDDGMKVNYAKFADVLAKIKQAEGALFMNDEVCMSIPVLTDDEEYILLKCGHCGNFFKGTPDDLQDGSVLHVLCPSYGLISDNYITDDVLEFAVKMAANYANNITYDAFKNLERHNRVDSMIRFKAEKKPHHETEDPIRSGIEALEMCTFPCCKRTAKVESLLKMTGAYCPFCGVKNYEAK